MRRINIDEILIIDGIPLIYIEECGYKWFPLKRLCEVLEIDYPGQFKNIRHDPIFKDQLELLRIFCNTQHRRMLCICETALIGYICQTKSKSLKLNAFRLKCFELLYTHFKGSFSLKIPIPSPQ